VIQTPRIGMIGDARLKRVIAFGWQQTRIWLFVLVGTLFGLSGCGDNLAKRAALSACQCAEHQTQYRLSKIDAHINRTDSVLDRGHLLALIDSLNKSLTHCHDSVRKSPEYSKYLSDSAHYLAFNAATSPCGDRILPQVESVLNRVRQALIERNHIRYPQARKHSTQSDSIPLSLEPEAGIEPD
jgi:hypothetical protein